MPPVPGLGRLIDAVEFPLTIGLLVLAFLLVSLSLWIFKLYRQSIADRLSDRDVVARERLDDARVTAREIARFNELLTEFNRLTADQNRALADVMRTGGAERGDIVHRLTGLAQATDTIRIELQVASRAMKVDSR